MYGWFLSDDVSESLSWLKKLLEKDNLVSDEKPKNWHRNSRASFSLSHLPPSFKTLSAQCIPWDLSVSAFMRCELRCLEMDSCWATKPSAHRTRPCGAQRPQHWSFPLSAVNADAFLGGSGAATPPFHWTSAKGYVNWFHSAPPITTGPIGTGFSQIGNGSRLNLWRSKVKTYCLLRRLIAFPHLVGCSQTIQRHSCKLRAVLIVMSKAKTWSHMKSSTVLLKILFGLLTWLPIFPEIKEHILRHALESVQRYRRCLIAR